MLSCILLWKLNPISGILPMSVSCHALYGAGRLPPSDPVGFPLETRSNSERR